MSLQLKQTSTLKISQDSGTNPLLMIANISDSITDTTSYEEAITLVYKLATATTDQAINLGSVATPKGLYIQSDKEITMKLNDTDGTDRGLVLPAGLPTLMHAEFSALYLSNASGDTATIRIVVFGDT